MLESKGLALNSKATPQDPLVAHLAWQLDVWGLQSLHWQGHPLPGFIVLAVDIVA